MQENIKSMVRGFMCGYCFAQSGYDIVFADHSETRHVYGDLLEGKAIAVLKCRNCRMLNLLVFSVKEEDFGVQWKNQNWNHFSLNTLMFFLLVLAKKKDQLPQCG